MNHHATLTPCENEIAQLIAAGQTKKEVADKTFRSVGTVEKTLKNVYTKLEISKATELTAWWIGKTFGISKQIADKKREILAVLFIVLMSVDISFNYTDDFCRYRRRNRRRCEETETLISI